MREGDGELKKSSDASRPEERKRAEETIEQDLRDTQVLHDLAAHYAAGDVQALYDKILEAAVALTRADAGTLQFLDETKQELVILAEKNLPLRLVEGLARVGPGSVTSCGRSLLAGERTSVDFDAPGVPDPDGSLKMHVEAGLLSAQSTPLVTRSGRLIGLFTTHWCQRRRPAERELHFLDLLARQAADLIEHRRDVEALRESEDRLQMALRATRDAVWDWDLLTGGVLWWNENFRIMLGYREGEIEPSYEAWKRRLHPEDAERVLEEVRVLIESGEEKWAGEYRYLRGDGSSAIVHDRCYVVRDAEGHAVRMVGSVTDITERRRAEEERLRLLRELVTAREEERSRVARDLHDSVSQYLYALNMNISALKRSPTDPRPDESLSALQETARQLVRVIGDIGTELRPHALDDFGLEAALSDYVKRWSERYNKSAIFRAEGLTGRLPPEVETTVFRVVQEALTNVVKHSGAGRVSVTVTLRSGRLAAAVEDDGGGFDVQEVIKKAAGERSLGLLGMRERAALVGGELVVKSAPGSGTSVTVFITISPARALTCP